MAKVKRKKGPRQVIGLKCSESGVINYITTKNKNNTTGKLKLKKFSPQTRAVTIHVETTKLK